MSASTQNAVGYGLLAFGIVTLVLYGVLKYYQVRKRHQQLQQH